MPPNTDAVIQLLRASLVPQTQKQAESELVAKEKEPEFSLALLQITEASSNTLQDRLAAALCFKNLIRRNWTDADGNYLLTQHEVTSIKGKLVGLMISVPPAIRTQIGEATSLIAESDFYQRWPDLVDDLANRLTPDDPLVNNGVLTVAHSIFRRWRPLFSSDELYTEINFVLGRFGGPFVKLFVDTDSAIERNAGNKDVLKQLFATLDTIFQVLLDLSCQDLPPIFEENMNDVSRLLLKYLTYDNQLLRTDDDEEIGPLETVKSSILEVSTLYSQKYEDVFGAHIPQFLEASWTLLTTMGLETKYDLLASRAMNFLASVCSIKTYAEKFNDNKVLGQAIEGFVLPNLALRESDMEMFEDDPIEFIRRDLEGSDSETRRKAATDFVRKLMTLYTELVTTVVTTYINHYLEDYSKDKSAWKSKDTATYLFTSIAAVGTVMATQGLQTTNPHVNVLDFFQKHIAQDLLETPSSVILQVDAIKFLHTFRAQMTAAQWQEVLPMLLKHLESQNYVVHTYCAITLDRVLLLTGPESQAVVARSQVSAIGADLLKRLFKLITKDTAPEKIQENEFLMRCVMRILIVMKEDIVKETDLVLGNLINIMKVIRHNPSNPRFYYFLFEAMGALIKSAAPTQPQKFDDALNEPFGAVLQNDVQEFMPYVFQLLAALLEANPSGSLAQLHLNLIQPILTPALWDSKGNTPALVRLLSGLIARGAEVIVQNNQVEPVLGIFQKLISSKANETFGFELLDSLIIHLPPAALQSYWQTIFTLLLTRLSGSATGNFRLCFCTLYHLMSARLEQGLGADFAFNICEVLQAGLFAQIYPSAILPSTPQLARPLDRKLAVISLTKTLGESQVFAEKFAKGWARSCEALLTLMLDPPKPPPADSITTEQDVDDLSFGVGFTQLNTCRKAPTDLYPEIQDLKPWISQYLKQSNDKHGGRIMGFIQERLPEESKTTFVSYLQA